MCYLRQEGSVVQVCSRTQSESEEVLEEREDVAINLSKSAVLIIVKKVSSKKQIS
tara:strand:- start:541 stop:705 length:165 start_codon:yes stop_codon:yes gene_type:complete